MDDFMPLSAVEVMVKVHARAASRGERAPLLSMLTRVGVVGGVPVLDAAAVLPDLPEGTPQSLPGDISSADFPGDVMFAFTRVLHHLEESPSLSWFEDPQVGLTVLAARTDDDAFIEADSDDPGLRYALVLSPSVLLLAVPVKSRMTVLRVNYLSGLMLSEDAQAVLSRIQQTLRTAAS